MKLGTPQGSGTAATVRLLRTMSLNFPNQSRSYDATLRAVRFWGHDGPMEAAFFCE